MIFCPHFRGSHQLQHQQLITNDSSTRSTIACSTNPAATCTTSPTSLRTFRMLQLLFTRNAFIPHLEELLRYHALNGEHFTDQFLANNIVPALNTEGLQIGLDPFLVVNGIRIGYRKIDATNSVTHVINGVLKPDWVDNSVLGVVTIMDDPSILLELLERADLKRIIKDGSHHTSTHMTRLFAVK
jgi:hypothetical protein